MQTQWGRIDERFVDGVAILEVRGRIRASLSGVDGGRLFGRIQQLLDQGWLKILLNLAGVRYIDSEGLVELAHGCSAAKKAGGRLTLCGVDQRIRDAFVITKLNGIFEVFDSEDEALRSFGVDVGRLKPQP